MGNLIVKPFSEIDISQPFFDSLKDDYPGFCEWYNRKATAGAEATVYVKNNEIQDFLYLKIEDEELDPQSGFTPGLPKLKRLKVGTFKIEARGTKRGERFIKRILDFAITQGIIEIYVTIFPKHESLINLFQKYGFIEVSKKYHQNGSYELVLSKKLDELQNDIIKDYPLINVIGVNKYLLSIYPKYHTKLFPDSILNNESYDLIKDLSPTNSIHKVYICFMSSVICMRKGDIVLIYRTTDIPGRAYYRSVVTSVCVIEEVLEKASFKDSSDFIAQTNKYSIFSESDLHSWYRKSNVYVIKMTYNLALTRRVTRGCLIDELGMDSNAYWGFISISENQFESILKKGEANENYLVNKA